MESIFTNEYSFKFGSLIQFGVSYMSGFSTFADEFLANYNLHLTDGYNVEWEIWQKNNFAAICNLYDELNAVNLIPKNSIT